LWGTGVGLLRTNVYIDGFNLYYGLLKGTPYKWLNLETFCDLLLPKNDVQRIVYCTAKVEPRPYDPDQPLRQLAYLRALATLPRVEIVLGNFMSSVVRQPIVATDPATGRSMRDANNQPVLKTDANGAVVTDWILKTEEKGSDVNLASHLLRDAYQKICDGAVIISNDSDLLTPIRMAKQAGLIIGLVPPRPKGSIELRRLSDFIRDPRGHILGASQFPETISDQNGTIHRPTSW
jgi:uncharacterized LabA/DUF88 family protein